MENSANRLPLDKRTTYEEILENIMVLKSNKGQGGVPAELVEHDGETH